MAMHEDGGNYHRLYQEAQLSESLPVAVRHSRTLRRHAAVVISRIGTISALRLRFHR
jgi:hypothetical protein